MISVYSYISVMTSTIRLANVMLRAMLAGWTLVSCTHMSNCHPEATTWRMKANRHWSLPLLKANYHIQPTHRVTTLTVIDSYIHTSTTINLKCITIFSTLTIVLCVPSFLWAFLLWLTYKYRVCNDIPISKHKINNFTANSCITLYNFNIDNVL